MPIVQTSYGLEQKASGPGALADGGRASILSRTVDEAGVSFGHPCFATSDRIVSSMVSGANGLASGTFLGIATSDTGEPAWAWASPQGDIYPGLSTVSVLTKGTIWVLAGSDVRAGDAAYVTSGGAITSVATGNLAINGRFDDTGPAQSLVRLRLG